MLRLRSTLTLGCAGILLCGSPARGAPADPAPESLTIRPGPAPVVDGNLSPGEWGDAGSVLIEVRPGWTVAARFRHDAENLYIAFTNLKHGDEERYPEVLIGTGTERAAQWQPTDHWFHASYRVCDASGRPNDYGSCMTERAGWTATTYPISAAGTIEMRISYERIGLVAGEDRQIRIAFTVTDTREQWSFWPRDASMLSSLRWAAAESPTHWRGLEPQAEQP
jgi:hypothetical protein